MSRYDGKTTRRRFKKLRIDEISVVDQPAHGPALVAIMKRAPADELEKSRMAITTLTAGHAHSVVMIQADSERLAELKAGETSFSDGHSHKWVMDDAGNVIIAEAEGHNHTLAILVKDSQLFPAEAEAEGTTSKETIMSDTKKTEAEVDAANAVQKQLDELTQKNERLASVVSLSPEQRTHFDTLKGEAADEFLKVEDKDALVKNEQSEDPVVYTNLDGREFKKSADPVVLDLVKSNDELRKAALASELVAKRSDLVKRANVELEHLTGEEVAKADLLGAVDGLSVEKREAVMAILKTKDAGIAKAMETIGTSTTGSGATAHQQIEAIAKRLCDADSTLSKAKAYVAALDTPEGKALQSQLL